MAGVAAIPLLLAAAMVGGLVPGPNLGAVGTGVSLVPAGAALQSPDEPLRPGSFRVTQGFGCTQVGLEPAPPAPYSCPPDSAHPAAGRFHSGLDLAAPLGTVAYAVAGGAARVVYSGGGFGLHIVLTPAGSAGGGVSYLYGHLSGTAVADGAVVHAGDPLGFVGSTGNSSGPHLHFEVDVGRVPSNPCLIFPPGYLPAAVVAAGCDAWAI